jgi:hypothetical protein
MKLPSNRRAFGSLGRPSVMLCADDAVVAGGDMLWRWICLGGLLCSACTAGRAAVAGGPADRSPPQPVEQATMWARLDTGAVDVALQVPVGAHLAADGPTVTIDAGSGFSLIVQTWPDRDLGHQRELLANRLGDRWLRVQSEDRDALIVQATPARDGSGGGYHLEALIDDGDLSYRCRSRPSGSFVLSEVEQMLAACRTIVTAPQR